MKTNYFTKLVTGVLTAATFLLTNQLTAQPWSVAKPGPAVSPSVIDAKDIIYSNGYLYSAGTQYNNGGHFDLLIAKTNLAGTVITTVTRDYHGLDDVPVKIKNDAAGNIYVLSTGAYFSTDRDLWLVKYDANLTFIWSTYYHFADEAAVDMAISGSDIYVAGNTVSSATGSDIALARFSTAGALIGSTRFNFGATTNTEAVKAMVLDGSSLFLCGYRDTAVTGTDGVLLKYNTSLTLQWSKAWSPTGGLSYEKFNSLVINGSYIFAGGSGWSLTTKNDFLLAKFNKTSGAYVSRITANSTAGNDEVRKVCSFGTDIYVTGITETSASPLKNKIVTSKFSTSLVQATSWPIKYQPSNHNYECNDMKVNNYGTVAIAGTVKKISPSGVGYTAAITLIYQANGTKLTEYQTPNNVGCNTVESSGQAIVFHDPNYDYNIAVAGGNRAWYTTVDCISSHRIEITNTLLRPAGDDADTQNTEARSGENTVTETETAFTAFPNPAFNELQVTGNKTITGYTVTDLNGKVFKTEITDQRNLVIDISKLIPGSYLIILETASEKTTKRFIKM